MTKAVTTTSSEVAAPTQVGNTPAELLRVAIEAGADVDKLAKLMDWQERDDAKQARRAFDEAMAKFQAERPQVIKGREVKDRSGRLLYKHANTDDITTTIGKAEHEAGFSHRFDFEPIESGGCKATCIVRHIAGHEERTTVTIPPTTGNNTNAAQNRGIEMQYGAKYALCGAYGISIGDEDTDGNVPPETITAAQAKQLKGLFERSGLDVKRCLVWAKCASIDELPADKFQEACNRCLAEIAKQTSKKDELPL